LDARVIGGEISENLLIVGELLRVSSVEKDSDHEEENYSNREEDVSGDRSAAQRRGAATLARFHDRIARISAMNGVRFLSKVNEAAADRVNGVAVAAMRLAEPISAAVGDDYRRTVRYCSRVATIYLAGAL